MHFGSREDLSPQSLWS
uniref:Uncharacterized protein n=1 Tax=Moniliophthora roreri TaxID=221103 RepID=A0A0W0FYF6_MONRR